MELELFTDLIDALGKVAGGLKAIVNLPKAERETIRDLSPDRYHAQHGVIRRGDLLLLAAAAADFLREAVRLDNDTNGCKRSGSSGCAAACAWPCAKRRRWAQ